MEKLATVDDEVMSDDLCTVIGALPRQSSALIEGQSAPGEGAHVELIDRVQLLLVERASPEQQQNIAVLVVIKGEV